MPFNSYTLFIHPPVPRKVGNLQIVHVKVKLFTEHKQAGCLNFVMVDRATLELEEVESPCVSLVFLLCFAICTVWMYFSGLAGIARVLTSTVISSIALGKGP